ncbi:hypothetical protein CSB07_01730 [Candidatus Gracilibacteria bacterium]|nr:MAG: hypothetical protein CSB07_01730 [Candidatus Gracilibacteria bacterium]PIE85190.1 MAG: hypothetical protein CSA08_02940 [Candidatus Gracilibacteria bacterium]
MKQNNRKRTRHFLFQKLYAKSFNNYNEETFLDSFYKNVFVFGIDEDYLSQMESLIEKKEEYLIYIFHKYAPKFDIKNTDIIYILPVFIGLTEMLYLKEEIPPKVSINEAIELSKLFGTETTKKVVNGILNKVFKDYDNLVKELEELNLKKGYSFFTK